MNIYRPTHQIIPNVVCKLVNTPTVTPVQVATNHYTYHNFLDTYTKQTSFIKTTKVEL